MKHDGPNYIKVTGTGRSGVIITMCLDDSEVGWISYDEPQLVGLIEILQKRPAEIRKAGK